MKSRLRSLLTFIIGWPLSLIALFFIIRLIISHFTEIESHLHHINYTLTLIGGLCFVLYYFFRSYMYQKILNFLGYPLRLQETAYYWGQSELHRYIPGNVWSFLGRTVLFSRKNVSRSDITLSLIVESQLVCIGTILVTLLGVPFILQTFVPELPDKGLVTGVAVLASLFLIAFFLSFSRLKRMVKQPLLRKFLFTPFTVSENLLLLALSALCFLFFGLGYYFTITSIYPLHLQLIWALSGFFAFSLLVGYLSILTPTGLGIREGIVVFGLKSMVAIPILSFASIFTRVLLIISEVLYLFISYLWHKTKNKTVAQIEPWVSRNKIPIILGLGMVIYVVYFTVAGYLRYDNFYTGRFDLGNMSQTVWNTSHGKIFEFTNPNGTEEISRLAFHADFILVLLAPFYYLWSDPRMLILIQAVVVALGSIFVFLIAQHLLKGNKLPLLLATMYLLNPGVERATLYEFHAVTLATTFLLGAFYFMLKKRTVWLVIFLILAGLTKEEVWLIVALFGLYTGVFQKRFILGPLLAIGGVIMFVYLLFYAIPQAAGSQHFALSYYSDFGDKPGVIIKNMLFSPQKTLPILFLPDRMKFFREIFGPLGYISFFSPLYLIFAGGDFMIDFLSNNSQLHQIYYQYTATLTPFIFISAMYGIKRLTRIPLRIRRVTIGVYLFIAMLLTAYLYGPLPGAKDPNIDMFVKPLPNASQIDAYLSRLPASYSIAASNNLGSHLSHRQKIYTVPVGIDKADVVALLTDPTTQGSDQAQEALINKLKDDPHYLVFYDFDGFIVFKKIQDYATMNK